MAVQGERVRRWLPGVLLVIALWLMAGCGQAPADEAPGLFGADSTSFRAELDSARALLGQGDIARAEPLVRAILAGAVAPDMVRQRALAIGYLGNIMQRRNLLDSAANCHRA
ncbi:MAG: hypothetical protein RBT71_14560, partial [Flavobacteriales bacterium]|nr:hypothetical protein [Flavobacteriales bacterium]